MILRYHKKVQQDINTILEKYYLVSDKVAEGFWEELNFYLKQIRENPGHYGYLGENKKYRRVHLKRYPYTIVYRIFLQEDKVRVLVVRHQSRHENFGLRRKF